MNKNELSGRILLVDDDEAFRTLTSRLLVDEGFEVTATADARSGFEYLQHSDYDLILTDLMMEGINGIQFLRQIKQAFSQKLVIMITGFASIDSAVEAMRLGAFDYLTKPCSNEELLIKIKKAMAAKLSQDELERLRSEVYEKYRFHNLVGKSEAMQRLFRLIEQVADSDTTVLIAGETGTGKELVARALHYNSSRRDQPFIAVNCAALPDTLLESELFGHEKGAFSGAIRQKLGRFELANHGTLFLDEIGDIPLTMQVKLLRVLQENAFERLGGTETIHVNIRLISATNKNLQEEIEKGKFRQDLYFRLNVMPLYLPPLRERIEDVPLLAGKFIEHFNREKGRNVRGLTDAALRMMLNYSWPGNIRELENIIERAVLLCRDELIDVEHLMFQHHQGATRLLQEAIPKNMTEEELVSLYARMILKVCDGNKKRTCEILGINFKTLQKRLGGK